jgi:hypothetical protein
LVESVVFTIEAALFGTPQGRVFTDAGDDKYIFLFLFFCRMMCETDYAIGG